ncbi:hypothetical protein M406DRAFT_223238, partial [Cryphonectria parasitica EP155]
IESTSYEIMLYSLYLEEGVQCKMVNEVKSYSQYTKRSCSCDAGWISISSLSRITDELVHLDSREIEEEECLLKCQREL